MKKSEFIPEYETDIIETLDTYFDEMKAIDRLNHNTIYNREFELKRFISFCKSNNIDKPYMINRKIVISYLGILNITSASKKTVMFILERYMDYLVNENLILENWASLIPKPKSYMPESDHLTLDEINTLFQSEANNAKEKFIDRNILLLTLFTNLCLRVSEVLNLKFKDVRFESKEIWIKRKRSKIAKIFLNDHIVEKFKNWYSKRDEFKGSESDWIFISTRGTQLTPRQTRHIIGQSLQKAGIEKRKSGTHLLRHSGASLLSEAGENPTMIQYLLGHENIATTNRYLHFNSKAMKEMVQRSPSFG